jgi:hypothetical protein
MPRAVLRPAVVAPSHEDVVEAVRAAIHNPDPLLRAEAAARLMRWDLPVSPHAIVVAARRAMEALPA